MVDWRTHALCPNWPAPAKVRALSTTRQGGVSLGGYDSFNLATHVGDIPEAVAANRALLRQALPADPCWLEQVHGIAVVDAETIALPVPADASVAFRPGVVCVVQTADCLPVLLARCDGTAVGAVHAGWRGLCQGVIEATVNRLGPPGALLAWLGPAIGPDAFEVGEDVRTAFMAHDPQAQQAFAATGQPGKWRANLYQLARQRLTACGVWQVYGGDYCTVADAGRFYSFRRDRNTGRMASLVWLAPEEV